VLEALSSSEDSPYVMTVPFCGDRYALLPGVWKDADDTEEDEEADNEVEEANVVDI